MGGIERTATLCWQYPFKGQVPNHEAFGFIANPDNPLNAMKPR